VEVLSLNGKQVGNDLVHTGRPRPHEQLSLRSLSTKRTQVNIHVSHRYT
jgi:hypothetical protein